VSREGERRRAPSPGAVRLGLTVVALACLAALAPPVARAAERPNIVVVATDDQDAASVNPPVMPHVTRLLGRHGTSFDDAVASGPLCCPSRATFLTGQYGHSNGVLWNNPGGYADLREKANTLPVWLERAGYRTAHVGRYLNGYRESVGDTNRAAPGWNEWHTVLDPASYYSYVLRANGHAIHYGNRDHHHLTRVLTRAAVGVVERYAPSRAPLFLVVDHLAPHRSGVPSPRCGTYPTPDPRDRDAFADEPLPMAPSFNEPDVADKPSFVRARPGISAAGVAEVTREHRCRLASLRSVDRGVARIYDALRAVGEHDDTVFVFTSDNGWLAGQHRVPGGKVLPYEESLRVPLLVRLPERIRGPAPLVRSSGAPVANIDLAPTLLELARARPCAPSGRCRVLDGRSLLPLLRGRWGGGPAIGASCSSSRPARAARRGSPPATSAA
jgi:N-acetylglucosamine-6-sulfatase